MKNHPATTFKSLEEKDEEEEEEEEEDLIEETTRATPTVAVELGFLFEKRIL